MSVRALAPERGSSLVFVLGILTVLGLVLGVLASVLMTDLRATRRRANDRYAAELARSGVDYARAFLMEKGSVPGGTLRVQGGEIEVRVEELPAGGRRIVSVGRVVVGVARVAGRREVVVIGPPAKTPDVSGTP